MDVLLNYTTYKRFFGLIKQVENDRRCRARRRRRRSPVI